MPDLILSPIASKKCSKCGECKPLADYAWNDKTRGTLRPECRLCKRKANAANWAKNKDALSAKNAIWRAENSESQKAYQSAYFAANKERISKRKSDWSKANPGVLSIRSADYQRRNPEKVKAASDKWNKENKDKNRASEAKWREANPEKRKLICRQSNQNRRAKKKAGGGRLSAGIVERLKVLQQGKCACCGKPLENNFHLDHIMPLALGGKNEDGNVQLLTSTCNQQKHAKHPVDFMQERGFLL